ncbi:hypothetical protein APHAL10511_007516 [Amanita phalloides]|nr:hypothetical protein APHAL10511_007516 [Amanita phalloides]
MSDTISTDEQLDATTALAFISITQKHIEHVPPVLEPRGYYAYDDDVPDSMVSILRWIATSFVRGARGSNTVAAALSARPGTLTLYLAKTPGVPDDEDAKNSRAFVCALRRAMSQSQKSTVEAVTTLFEAAISVSHRRFAHRVGAVLRMERVESEVEPRFNAIVDRWVAKGGVEKGDDEDAQGNSLRLFARRRRLFSDKGLVDGEALLKLVFRRFITLVEASRLAGFWHDDDSPQTEQTIAWAADCCQHASALLGSGFFEYFTSPHERRYLIIHSSVPEAEAKAMVAAAGGDAHWMKKLAKRLWCVARYRTDAFTFATEGFEYIRDALGTQGYADFLSGGGGTVGDPVQVDWVATPPPPPRLGITLPPHCPLSLLDSMLEKHGLPHLNLDETNPTHQAFSDAVRSLWWPGPPVATTTTTAAAAATTATTAAAAVGRGTNAQCGAAVLVPHLHSEIQLIQFFDRHATGVAVHRNYIGASQLSCWACKAYMEGVNCCWQERRQWPREREEEEEEEQEPWIVEGTSDRVKRDWLVPSDQAGRGVLELVQFKLSQALKMISHAF